MNRNFAKLILQKFDSHIFVIGRTGSGKSTLVRETDIKNSKYLDFIELTKSGEWPEPGMLCEINASRLEEKIISSPEKTFILDAVEFPANLKDSKIISLIKKSIKYGKRLIILAFPENAEPVLQKYYQSELDALAAIIRLDRKRDTFNCDVETFFAPDQEEK